MSIKDDTVILAGFGMILIQLSMLDIKLFYPIQFVHHFMIILRLNATLFVGGVGSRTIEIRTRKLRCWKAQKYGDKFDG